MKKNKLKLFGFCLGSVALVASAIAPAIALSSCASGSGADANNGETNNGANNQNPPVAPLPAPNAAELENITTFAQAMDFTNKYLQKNYTLEMFKSDLLNKFKLITNDVPNVEYVLNSVSTNSQNKNNIDFSVNHIGVVGTHKQIISINIQNSLVYPYLCYDIQNQILIPQIAIFFNPFYGYQSSDTEPAPTSYNSLEELKRANPDWSNKIIVNSQIKNIENGIEQNQPSLFFIGPADPIIKNKIFEINKNYYGLGANGYSILLNGAFSFNANKITDLQQHLQK